MMEKTLIKPLADRVLIERIEGGEESHSGIIIPKTSDGADTKIGVVVAVGSGRKTEAGSLVPIEVSVGQKVIFSWGDKVETGGKEYYMVSEASLLGILGE